MSTKVALVTGANRGIGLEIVRQLLKKFNGTVLLTARNIDNGVAAVKQLQSEGLTPEFLQLDVSDRNSIEAARKTVNDKYGRVDVLVNNAGIMMNMRETGLANRARCTIEANFFSTLYVTQAFWELLQPNSRIVNLSSGLGNISYLGNEWRTKLSSPDLSVDMLVTYMNKYIEDAASSDITKTGWHTNMPAYSDSYSVSKIGVNRLTLLHAKLLQNDPRSGILMNCVCPGWVRTDMGTDKASKSVEEGADTPVYLSLLPPSTNEPQGKFLRERKILEGYQ